MKQEKMKADKTLLDFGSISKKETESNIRMKDIVLTVYSNSEWILLAKPNRNDFLRNNGLRGNGAFLSYQVKTSEPNSEKFYPFIKDDYIIIASGEKTEKNGHKLEIVLRLEKSKNQSPGKHMESIDFVLLTKERYYKKMKEFNNPYFVPDTVSAT